MRARNLAAAFVVVCAFSSTAVAHPDRNGYYWQKHDRTGSVPHRVGSYVTHGARYIGSAGSRLAALAMHYLGDGNITGFRGPWCGAFLSMVARKADVQVPRDPNLAANWRFAGPHLRYPVPGSIMVMAHHVADVIKVKGARVLTVSGNHGDRVGLGWYSVRAAIAFVEPVGRKS